MKLQSFLKILLLSNIVFGQVTLSKEEVRNIANKIDSLQTADSLNNSIIEDFRLKSELDELAIAELEQQIKTHEDTIKPRWYEGKFFWGLTGALPAYYIGYLIGKL